MKILLVTDGIWNDLIYGNNMLENWFNNLNDIEFAQIATLPGKPNNKHCLHYFQVTDMMMFKSLFSKNKAGEVIETSYDEMKNNTETQDYIKSSGFYSFLKKISGHPVRLTREFLWSIGHYNKKKLEQFIINFNPDIVFCPRLSTWKTMRLEKLVSKYTQAPFIAYTGDDEASFRQYSLSPLFWINRFFFNHSFKKHIKLFKYYFTGSQTQSEEYKVKYSIPSSPLYKSGNFSLTFNQKKINNPIRMVFAGHIYCNRWKTLEQIGKTLKNINQDGIKIILDVYTPDLLTTKQKKVLSESNYIYLKRPVSSDKLKDIYKGSDIALHVESMDKKNKLLTRVSFSTKIIDLMNSTCAIMCIAWNQHAGYKYLEDNNAAFCISSYDQIQGLLESIIKSPKLLQKKQKDAYECGKKNHSPKVVQNDFLSKIEQIIQDNHKQKIK